ncbi:MAG: PhnD/SsuA/transferrin family substrate-binding protein [Oscillatoriaceae cyanobacterium Prado104]|jgi:phosphonate transport system substrate-binding protein|nr:PhnD/SsuA/transferrin family substrate-binding protein [Oscillatoriaceae cyanobacterium Prado104]
MNRRFFIGNLLLFVTGCTATQVSNSVKSDRIAKIRFAIADGSTLESLTANYEMFRVALAEILEMAVEFVTLKSQVAGAIALKQGQVDFLLAGPSEYVIARSRTNAVAVIAITRPNYYSIIAVSPNSEIKTVADLRGKTIAMSDIGSTSGHLGPTQILIEAGLDPKTDVKIQMLGDEGSVAALQKGEVDAWAGSTSNYQEILQGKFPTIAKSALLPSDVFLAGSSLEPATVEFIRSRMIQHENKLIQAISARTKKYRGSTFKVVRDSDYNLIRKAYQAIGQDDFIVN